jgi:glutamate 5-kinase
MDTAVHPEWPPPQRVVLKFGTNLLTSGDALDEEAIRSLVDQASEIKGRGIEVLIVTSGAVAAGRSALARTPSKDRLTPRTVAYRQALAALGQAQLMRVYERLFGEHGIVVAQALISRGDLQRKSGQRPLGYLNVRNTLEALLDIGAVPIINENDVVAVDELEGEVYGDNDRLSAMVANAVDADLLVLLGEMEGLFTADPHLDPEALVVPVVEEISAAIEKAAGKSLDSRGRGGMASKVEAARLATASGTHVVIASGRTKRVIPRLCDGEPIGTRFASRVSHVEARKRWILTGLADSQGGVTVDAGAVKALQQDGRSLLPAGITAVHGTFERGDIIRVLGPDGRMVASGLANYGSVEVQAIKGKRSKDAATLLQRTRATSHPGPMPGGLGLPSEGGGREYGPEVIHRNNMAVV